MSREQVSGGQLSLGSNCHWGASVAGATVTGGANVRGANVAGVTVWGAPFMEPSITSTDRTFLDPTYFSNSQCFGNRDVREQ